MKFEARGQAKRIIRYYVTDMSQCSLLNLASRLIYGVDRDQIHLRPILNISRKDFDRTNVNEDEYYAHLDQKWSIIKMLKKIYDLYKDVKIDWGRLIDKLARKHPDETVIYADEQKLESENNELDFTKLLISKLKYDPVETFSAFKTWVGSCMGKEIEYNGPKFGSVVYCSGDIWKNIFDKHPSILKDSCIQYIFYLDEKQSDTYFTVNNIYTLSE